MVEQETINKIIKHVDNSVSQAEKQVSKIYSENMIKYLKGLNSPRLRHLLNNLCSIEGTCYLEIGAYRGASLVCALWKNAAKGYAVDNFKYNYYQPEIVREAGWKDIEVALNENIKRFEAMDKVTILKSDIEKLKIASIKNPINILYYDIDLNDSDLSDKAITMVYPKLADVSIIISNHSRLPGVITGIENSLINKNAKIHKKYELKSNNLQDNKTWWSGVTIWIIEKQKG